MKKSWDLKKVLSYLELERQGRGIIMEVTRPLLLAYHTKQICWLFVPVGLNFFRLLQLENLASTGLHLAIWAFKGKSKFPGFSSYFLLAPLFGPIRQSGIYILQKIRNYTKTKIQNGETLPRLNIGIHSKFCQHYRYDITMYDFIHIIQLRAFCYWTSCPHISY